MAMHQQLVPRAQMSQQLRMTPQLQQAIKLLQLSRMELISLVKQEMVENPVLEEVQEPYESESLYERERGIDQERQQREEAPQEVAEVTADERDLSKVDWENYVDNFSTPLPTNSYKGLSTSDLPGLEQTLSTSESLVDYMLEQLRMAPLDEQQKYIALLMIGNLDEYGYLKGQTVEEMAEDADATVEEIEDVLDILQSFEPVGVFARDLQECLLIQLERFHPKAKLTRKIVEEHIPNLERKSYGKIARALNVDKAEVIEAAKLIASLEPRPGRGFDTNDARYITPDIYIRKLDGEYVVVLNEDGLPKLKVSQYYKQELQRVNEAEKSLSTAVKKFIRDLVDEDDSLSFDEIVARLEAAELEANPYHVERFLEGLYIQNKLRGASWLIRSIYQRQSTIVKVTESIIKFQRDFFEKGVEHLRPLVLRDVAEDIDMHESTVSRVTTNKYVHTPRGIYELKFFFNSSITKHGGQDLASEAVKAKIREIIAGENPKKPLSDAKIVKILAEENIDIARRTVAKYREMMGILSSAKRKRVF